MEGILVEDPERSKVRGGGGGGLRFHREKAPNTSWMMGRLGTKVEGDGSRALAQPRT